MNASEEQLVFLFECTPTFILYHQHSARWSGLFNYFYYAKYWGGVKIFLRGGHFIWGVIDNIGGG